MAKDLSSQFVGRWSKIKAKDQTIGQDGLMAYSLVFKPWPSYTAQGCPHIYRMSELYLVQMG